MTAILEAHAATVLFGLAGLFCKWIAAPALVVAGLRTAVAAICLLGVVTLWPRLGVPPQSTMQRPGRGNALLAGLAGAILGVHWWMFFSAIQASTVAVALLAYSTAPGFVAILEPLVHRQAPSPLALLAAGLVLSGVALMVPRWSWSEATAVGAAWGVGAGLLFAILMLLNRKLVPVYGPVRLSCYLNIGASVVLLPFLPTAWVPLGAKDWILVAVLGLGFTVVAHTLFTGSLRQLKAQTASIISALEPVYGIIGAALLLGEVPTPRSLAGGAIIVATVLWISTRELGAKNS